MDFSVLKTIGLSENEIKIFITLLTTGTVKVDAISQKVDLPRTTIYGLLKSLSEKGLVAHSIKSGIKHYTATNPKQLVSMQEERIKELQKVVPLMESIMGTITEKPTIEVYEGIQGIKTVYQDIVNANKTIYAYGNTNMQIELLPIYVKNFLVKRIAKKIRIKVITEKNKETIELQKKDKQELRELSFLNSMNQMSVAIHIYGDKTAIISLNKKEPTGIIIKDEEITKSNKIIFDQLLKISSK